MKFEVTRRLHTENGIMEARTEIDPARIERLERMVAALAERGALDRIAEHEQSVDDRLSALETEFMARVSKLEQEVAIRVEQLELDANDRMGDLDEAAEAKASLIYEATKFTSALMSATYAADNTEDLAVLEHFIAEWGAQVKHLQA